MLYGACRRGAAALGFERLITYTLASEPGTSLRAAGWREAAVVKGHSWQRVVSEGGEESKRSNWEGLDKRRWEAEIKGQRARRAQCAS
ncbi:XF1762 family protein [Nannocystis pusilla]|uniref:XF1762 family protein n=1 Tax=Nannocystis pusilla TaxID=889268 RepID=UPI003B7BAD84